MAAEQAPEQERLAVEAVAAEEARVAADKAAEEGRTNLASRAVPDRTCSAVGANFGDLAGTNSQS